MQKNNWKLLLPVVLVFGFFSCKKDELPVPAPDKGSLITSSVTMSSNYKYQIYFDLSSNSNKGSNLKSNWDLGISCANGTDIILNTSKMMYAAAISDKTFEEISDTLGFGILKKSDGSTGNPTELALYNASLFIIDKGMNENGIHLGFFKLEIIENTVTNFKARCANINGSNEQTVDLLKDPNYNYLFVNWSNGLTTVSVEPPKEGWDIIFTQYTYLFHEPEVTYYLVTGCLLNTYSTQAFATTDISFESVDLLLAQSLTFNANRDNIGYDWKTFNGTTYEVSSGKTYIIKDHEGYFYKLRFIDFYDDFGEKGTPTFEYQKL